MEDRGGVGPKAQPTTARASASGSGVTEELARALVERYCARLRGLVRVIAGDRVRRGGTEDIVQDIWKSFLSDLNKGDAEGVDGDLWTKLAFFARRKSLKAVRQAHAQKRDVRLTVRPDPSSLAETLIAAPDPSLDEATDVADEIEHVVRRLVEGLGEVDKDRVRTIVGMRLDGHTHEETAKQVECSTKTVQRHLEAFREALQERLEAGL